MAVDMTHLMLSPGSQSSWIYLGPHHTTQLYHGSGACKKTGLWLAPHRSLLMTYDQWAHLLTIAFKLLIKPHHDLDTWTSKMPRARHGLRVKHLVHGLVSLHRLGQKGSALKLPRKSGIRNDDFLLNWNRRVLQVICPTASWSRNGVSSSIYSESIPSLHPSWRVSIQHWIAGILGMLQTCGSYQKRLTSPAVRMGCGMILLTPGSP